MRSRPGDRRLPLLVVDVVSNKPPRPDVTRLFRSLLLNSARAAGVAAIRIGKATAQSDTVPTATPRENQKTHRENQRTNNSPGPMTSGRYIFLIELLSIATKRDRSTRSRVCLRNRPVAELNRVVVLSGRT